MSKIIKPTDCKMSISAKDGFVVVELGTNWFAMSKQQTIEFVKALADCANRIS